MLRQAVGDRASNNQLDVKVVQSLLNKKRQAQAKTLLTVDGLYGDQTLGAIRDYQSTFMSNPDGIVSPYGVTIKKLWPVSYSNPTGKSIRGTDSYGGGHYGASRGRRTHDGVDYQSTETKASSLRCREECLEFLDLTPLELTQMF